MTKYLYPAPGQIILFCEVSSIKNRRRVTTREIGTNSMTNVFRDYNSKIPNAKLNSIYKHMKKGGGSDAIVTVIDYDFNYFDNLVTRKRVQRKTSAGKTKLYSVSVSKTTGKETGKAHLWRTANI